jgi:hypothetical protein
VVDSVVAVAGFAAGIPVSGLFVAVAFVGPGAVFFGAAACPLPAKARTFPDDEGCVRDAGFFDGDERETDVSTDGRVRAVAAALGAAFLAVVFGAAFFAVVFGAAFFAAVFGVALFAAVFGTAFFAVDFGAALFAVDFGAAFLAAVFGTAFFAVDFGAGFFAAALEDAFPPAGDREAGVAPPERVDDEPPRAFAPPRRLPAADADFADFRAIVDRSIQVNARTVPCRAQSQESAPPVWYSMTRVSKKFRSFLRSIISLIHGNGFVAPGNSASSPICWQRRFAI